MTYILILSILVFFLIHSISLNVTLRKSLIEKLGSNNRYKAVYSLIAGVSFTGMFLILRFYPGSENSELNNFVFDNIHKVLPLASILIIAAYIPNNHFKKYLRHPMLIGLTIWATTHLLINTQYNQDIFFFAMIAFNIYMIIGIETRDKFNLKAGKCSWKNDLAVVALGLIGHVSLIKLHYFLSGVSLS